MNCWQFNTIIVKLACDPLTDTGERHMALAHAQGCAQCAARLTRQQSVTAGLNALAMLEQTINAPAHLGAGLQAAFERQHARTAPQINFPDPIRSNLFSLMNWRWATAMAAVLLVTGVMVALWWQTTRRTSPVPTEFIAELTPSTVSSSANKRTNLAAQVPPKLKRRKTTRHEADKYGELISLMPIAPTETEEFQQVVRMQISRSTLQLWGLPLDQESDSEKVSAEVYFSETGVARAIRLNNGWR